MARKKKNNDNELPQQQEEAKGSMSSRLPVRMTMRKTSARYCHTLNFGLVLSFISDPRSGLFGRPPDGGNPPVKISRVL